MNWPYVCMYPLHPEPPSNLPPHPILPSCPRAPALGALLIKVTFLLHCSLLSVQYIALCLKKSTYFNFKIQSY